MSALSLTDIIVVVLTHDLLRYVIGAGGVYLVINIGLAAPLHHRKIRRLTPDVTQIRREILASLRTVLIFASVGVTLILGANYSVFRIYEDVQSFGWVYFWGSVLLIIVAHDAYFYWAHRLMHRPQLFRLLHRLHHRSHNPTPFTSYSFDPGEALVNALFLPLFLLIIPTHPLVLLLFTSHMMLRNALGHCGYEVFPANRNGTPLLGWLATVTHHDLHHAQAGYNMGLYFTWWDRWMGTEHPDYLTEYRRVTTSQPTPA